MIAVAAEGLIKAYFISFLMQQDEKGNIKVLFRDDDWLRQGLNMTGTYLMFTLFVEKNGIKDLYKINLSLNF